MASQEWECALDVESCCAAAATLEQNLHRHIYPPVVIALVFVVPALCLSTRKPSCVCMRLVEESPLSQDLRL